MRGTGRMNTKLQAWLVALGLILVCGIAALWLLTRSEVPRSPGPDIEAVDVGPSRSQLSDTVQALEERLSRLEHRLESQAAREEELPASGGDEIPRPWEELESRLGELERRLEDLDEELRWFRERKKEQVKESWLLDPRVAAGFSSAQTQLEQLKAEEDIDWQAWNGLFASNQWREGDQIEADVDEVVGLDASWSPQEVIERFGPPVSAYEVESGQYIDWYYTRRRKDLVSGLIHWWSVVLRWSKDGRLLNLKSYEI